MVVVTAVAVLGSGSLSARAQLGGLGDGTAPTAPSTTSSSTSSTTSSSSTTTTTRPASTTTTTQAPLIVPPGSGGPSSSSTTTTTAPSTSTTQEPLPPAEGDGAPAEGAGPVPPELQRMIDSVRRSAANNTKKLVAALAPLGQYGLDPTQQAVIGFGRFPVAGVATWSDDWWFPRFGPGWRLHQGLDIFAPYGTPVRAPVDGTVRITNGGLGGLAVYVVQPDRTYWYLAHLSGLAEGLAEGATVKTGQVVGFVGDSGNAKGGVAHLHFEIHPRGGAAVPPKPVVDRFVSDALALAPQLVDLYARASQQGQAAAPAVVAPEPVLDTLTPREALLWASAANPAGGTLRLVEADARAAAQTIDWGALAEQAQARDAAERDAWLVLRPLVPAPLARAIEGTR